MRNKNNQKGTLNFAYLKLYHNFEALLKRALRPWFGVMHLTLRGPTYRQAVDAQCRLTYADWDTLSLLAAGANSAVKRHV